LHVAFGPQTFPGQHAPETAPHVPHTFPAHVRLPLHVAPAQHGPAEPPHTWHVPALSQAYPLALHVPPTPPQHGCPAPPHATQCAPLQVCPLGHALPEQQGCEAPAPQLN
jgi:hypothetical protein